MLESLQLRLDGLEVLDQVFGVVLRVQDAQAVADLVIKRYKTFFLCH